MFGRRLEEERLAEKPEVEGQGHGGQRRKALRLLIPGGEEAEGLSFGPSEEKGAASLGLCIQLAPLLHFPTDNTYSFILSTNRHLSSPAGARHCAGLLCLKKAEMEMNEAVSDTGLRVYPPL